MQQLILDKLVDHWVACYRQLAPRTCGDSMCPWCGSWPLASRSRPQRLAELSGCCSQENYYRTAALAASWLDGHPEGRLIPVAEAYEMYHRVATEVYAQALSRG